jgi:hypothetical protein
MYWQLLIVGLIVVAALAYLARQIWRSWRGASSGCGGGCKCASAKSTSPDHAAPSVVHIPAEQLTLRRHA